MRLAYILYFYVRQFKMTRDFDNIIAEKTLSYFRVYMVLYKTLDTPTQYMF